MADFTPSKKTLQDFNNGVKYVDYDPTTGQNGDELQAETVNNLVESQMWTQKLAENPIFDNEIGVEGTPSLEIGTMLDGTPRLVAKHLVGKSAIMYNKVLALGSEESPISSLPTSYAFLKADFFALDYLLTDLSSIVNKTFLVSEVAYLTQSGSTVGEKHTYLTLYKITNADFVTIYASVVSRVETTGNTGIGISEIITGDTIVIGGYTYTNLEIKFTNGAIQSIQIKARNGNTPSTDNFVTTDTDQEITGSKTFDVEPDVDTNNPNHTKSFEIRRDESSIFKVTHIDEIARIEIDNGNIDDSGQYVPDGDVSLYFGGNAGTDGQVLTSHGENATPTWETPESGGLFEIPYDLTKLQSGSAGVDFIINNIEKIKKGAYFKWLSTTNVVITSVNSDNSTIELVFNAETIRNSDHYIQYNLVINKNNKTVGYYNFDIDGADLEDDPQLLICKFVGATATFTPSGFKATAANNGRVVGVQNGQFKLVDGGATITNITVTKVS